MAVIGATIGLAGITFATGYWMMLFSGALLGFFLLSSGPIGFQYGAEITYPISEGTSNGFLLLMGQISGIALIFGMDYFKAPMTGSMTNGMILLLVLMFLAILLSLMLKDSDIKNSEKNE